MKRKTKRENIKRWKIFRAEEKEAIICRRKIFFCLDKKTTEKEKDQLFGKRYWFVEKKNREGNGGKYFEKENILFEGNEEQIKKRRKILE